MATDTKYENLINGQNDQHNKKKKSVLSYVVSLGLGLIAVYAIISIIIIEVKGRKILKTPEEWRELIKGHPYERHETDVRSPCPMLNTLANHGFIARDGRNIKSDDLFKAIMLMGVPPSVTVGILNYVYSALKEANPETSFISQFGKMDTLDLDRLTVFGILEHDVSLTRFDTTQEPHNTQHPEPEFVHRLLRLAELKNKDTESEGILTRKNENDARRLRWLESSKYNKYLHLNMFSQFASSTECSLLLDVFGRDGSVSLPHLKTFLLNESFPEDWHPRISSYSVIEFAINTLICWSGLRKSKVSLDLLEQLQ